MKLSVVISVSFLKFYSQESLDIQFIKKCKKSLYKFMIPHLIFSIPAIISIQTGMANQFQLELDLPIIWKYIMIIVTCLTALVMNSPSLYFLFIYTELSLLFVGWGDCIINCLNNSTPNLDGIYLYMKGQSWFNLTFCIYSVAHANLDSSKNMLLLKNPQFLPNHYETLSQ